MFLTSCDPSLGLGGVKKKVKIQELNLSELGEKEMAEGALSYLSMLPFLLMYSFVLLSFLS